MKQELIQRIRNSAIIAEIFVILLMLIDSPVTIVGWFFFIGIGLFLGYIIIIAYLYKEK